MSSSLIKEFGQACWSEVYNRIIGAVVFLDDSSAECLHWHGGLFSLLSEGAVEVKSLSPFEFAKKEHKKAVFISQTTTTQIQTIREIIKNSQLTHCILISTISLDAVFLEMNEGTDVSSVVEAGRASAEASSKLEQLMSECMKTKICSTEVVHVPIFTIVPSKSFFITPPYCRIFPTFNGEIIPSSPNIGLYDISTEERSQVRRLASSLNSLMESMGWKEDVYYMGHFSSLVAGVLENSPVCLNRRKNSTRPLSLILVDGSLDAAAGASHAPGRALDRVRAALPPLPGHAVDVALDMSPLCEANVISVTDDLQLSPGCLHHEGDASEEIFEDLVHKTHEEVMQDLHSRLTDIDVHRSPVSKPPLKVTAQSIEKIIRATKGKYELIEQHCPLLQLALGLAQSSAGGQLELMARLQRTAHQALAASREASSLLVQISLLIQTRKDRKLPLERLLALLVHIYSLAGTDIQFNKEHELRLAQTLSIALLEENNNLFDDSTEGVRIVSKEQCNDVAKRVVGRLRDIAAIRKSSIRYGMLLMPSADDSSYTSLLQLFVEDLVTPARPELPDLRHNPEEVKDLLKSGFSILTRKKQRTPKHPMENPEVIIFVIGGLTAELAVRVQQCARERGKTIALGGAGLYTAVECARRALRLKR